MGAGARSGVPARSCDVLIAGGGPAGLFLAALLVQRGVDVAVLEQRTEPSTHSRAIGLHPPALVALRSVGMQGAVLAEGARVERGIGRCRGRDLGQLTFDRIWPDVPFVLTLPQHRTEALLASRLEELAPGALHRGWGVHGMHDDGGAVRVTAVRRAGAAGADPAAGGGEVAAWQARVLVGADGPRSAVRARAGIGTSSRPYPDSYLMGDFAETTGDGDAAVIHLEPGGVVESFPLPGGLRRWVAHTGSAPARPSPGDLAAIVGDRTGELLDPGTSTMISAFTVRRRLAQHMVTGRTVLTGDAAHEISPIGGQGMTLGWLDALALAPLLAELVADDPGRPLPSVPAFRDVERVRLRSARRAARMAELNMALGRPTSSAGAWARGAALRAVLGSPVRDPLTRAFTMAWA